MRGWLPVVVVVLAGALASARPLTPQAPAVPVLRTPQGGLQPQVAIDGRGVLHLVYLAGTNPAAMDVYYAGSTDGGRRFTSPVRVNSRPGGAVASGTVRGADLAVDPTGRVHIVWNGSSNGSGMPMLYARSSPDRASFETERNLMTRTTTLDGGGSVAVDDAGHVHVVWHGQPLGIKGGEDIRRVWLATSQDGGQTFAAERAISPASTGTCGCCAVRVASIRGDLHVLYRSATDVVHRDIHALRSRDGGATFSSELIDRWEIGACPMTSTSMAAALGDGVWRSWEHDGNVHFSRSGTTTRHAPPLRGDGTDKAPRKHPRLAVARDGTFLMTWTEGTGWARGGSIAWQVFAADGTPTAVRGVRTDLPVWTFGAAIARPDGGFTILY